MGGPEQRLSEPLDPLVRHLRELLGRDLLRSDFRQWQQDEGALGASADAAG